jgi:FixJ family two-component response regulator
LARRGKNQLAPELASGRNLVEIAPAAADVDGGEHGMGVRSPIVYIVDDDQNTLHYFEALLAQVRAADAENRNASLERAELLQRFEALTPRERDVLSLLMAGSSNKLMATDLNLSQRTVELYRARIMEKTGSRSLAQLIRMAIDLGCAPGARPQSRSH